MNNKQGIPIGMLKSVSPAKLVVAGDTNQFSEFQVGGMIVIPAPDYEVMGVVTNISAVNDVAAHFTQSPLASASQAPVDIDVCVVGYITKGKAAFTIPPRPPLASRPRPRQPPRRSPLASPEPRAPAPSPACPRFHWCGGASRMPARHRSSPRRGCDTTRTLGSECPRCGPPARSGGTRPATPSLG